jgi:curved DNA-binding protein CbpA
MDAYAVLGVDTDATEEEIRRAWLAGVREHPPDRDPEGFRRLREAYDHLRDPLERRAERLFGRPGVSTLTDLAGLLTTERRWLGPEAWLRLLRDSNR